MTDQRNNPQAFFKKKMLDDANDQIQATLASLREDVERIKINKTGDHGPSLDEAAVTANPEGERQRIEPMQQRQPDFVPKRNAPLIYFSYPVFGYTQLPAWVTPLREALVALGYLVYSPGEQVGVQFGKPDIAVLNSLEKRANRQTCSLLLLPEEVLSSYGQGVAEMIQAGDLGDKYGAYFKHLWFMVRSSLVVADITKPTLGGEIGQETLLARQLGIPTLGIMPESGHVGPWIQKSVTAFLAAEFNLNNIVPMIRGYAPL